MVPDPDSGPPLLTGCGTLGSSPLTFSFLIPRQGYKIGAVSLRDHTYNEEAQGDMRESVQVPARTQSGQGWLWRPRQTCHRHECCWPQGCPSSWSFQAECSPGICLPRSLSPAGWDPARSGLLCPPCLAGTIVPSWDSGALQGSWNLSVQAPGSR